MATARISEVFDSIQGEGLYFGQKHIFVRFFGCNLICKYCDTKMHSFMEYEPKELLKEIMLYGPGFEAISFTGGEPLLHKDFLKEILRMTKSHGYTNYLETNGTLIGELKEVIDDVDIVAMDIKLPSSTGCGHFWGIHRRFLKIACAKDVFLKAVICASTTQDDIQETINLIKEVSPYVVLVLQPNSCEERGVLISKLENFKELCVKQYVTACVIPQMHVAAGVR
jgi:7-carboxy-7-deazaguanine synthase